MIFRIGFDFWRSRKIDTEGVQRVNGKTFRGQANIRGTLTRARRAPSISMCFKISSRSCRKTYRQTDFVLLPISPPSPPNAYVLEAMERRVSLLPTHGSLDRDGKVGSRCAASARDLLIAEHSEARVDGPKERASSKAARRIQTWARARCHPKKVSTAPLLFGEGDRFLQLRRVPTPKTSTIRPDQGHVRRRMAGYLGAHKKVALQRSPQGNDLRKCAGQFLRGSIQPESCATCDGEIAKRYEMVQTDEHSKCRQNDDKRGVSHLLRRSLIVTGSCILAVVLCYSWLIAAFAFFVYDHHINEIEVFRWLTYPPPESAELGRL